MPGTRAGVIIIVWGPGQDSNPHFHLSTAVVSFHLDDPAALSVAMKQGTASAQVLSPPPNSLLASCRAFLRELVFPRADAHEYSFSDAPCQCGCNNRVLGL